VRARAVVVAEPDGYGRTRLTTLRSEPPLALRPTPTGLYLATSAAGPLGGDQVELSITVAAGATLVVRTVAATLALPGPGGTSTLRIELDVAGWLAVLPEPTIVADAAAHRATVTARVAPGGGLILREEVLLGRHNERGGRYQSIVYADAAGEPLLRSELTLDGADEATAGPRSPVGGRATGSLLFVGSAVPDAAVPDAAVPVAAVPGGAVPGGAAAGGGGAGGGGAGGGGAGGGGAEGAVPAAAMVLAGPGLLVNAVAGDGRALRAQLDRWYPSLVG
jgi:urease accessory protein